MVLDSNCYMFMKIFLLSMLPTFEGRYAVLAGLALGTNLLPCLMASVAGTLLLSLLLPLAFPYIDALLTKFRGGSLDFVSRFYDRYVLRARRKSRKYVEKWGVLGLVIFVAIPLPMTGVWTGGLVAFLLGYCRYKTVLSLAIGGILSIAVTLTLGGGIMTVAGT